MLNGCAEEAYPYRAGKVAHRTRDLLHTGAALWTTRATFHSLVATVQCGSGQLLSHGYKVSPFSQPVPSPEGVAIIFGSEGTALALELIHFPAQVIARPSKVKTLRLKLITYAGKVITCGPKLISCASRLITFGEKVFTRWPQVISLVRKVISCAEEVISSDGKVITSPLKVITFGEKVITFLGLYLPGCACVRDTFQKQDTLAKRVKSVRDPVLGEVEWTNCPMAGQIVHSPKIQTSLGTNVA